jgi:hypothetical protein
MFRIFNILLFWLVMLALPSQGFAAATMIDCGKNQPQAMQKIVADLDTVSGGRLPECQHQHQHQHQHPHHNHHDPAAKCSVCASCCFGAFATTSLDIGFTPDAAGLTMTRFPEKPFTVNFPAGLERPPHAPSI